MPNRLPACDHDHGASQDRRGTLPHRETVDPDPSPVTAFPLALPISTSRLFPPWTYRYDLCSCAPQRRTIIYGRSQCTAKKAAQTKKHRAAGKKAAKTRKLRAAGKKAARTRKLRAAGRKAATTRKRREAGRKAAATQKLKKEQSTTVPSSPQVPLPGSTDVQE
jgi:hypothetical protein